MNFLKDHGEKVATALIVLICGYFISVALNSGDSEEFQKLDDYKSKIQSAIKNNTVKDDWTWSQKKQPLLAKQLSVNFERPNEPLSATPGAYSVYPQPDKPWIVVDGNKVKDVVRQQIAAVLRAPQEFKVEPDHGRVYVHFKLGADTRYITPVRAEIYRGTEAGKIDQLIGTINLNPEEEIPVEAPKEETKKEPTAEETDPEKKEPKKPVDTRETARSKKKDPAATDTPDAPPAAPDAEKGGVPAEFAGVIVFTDNNVEAKKNLFYKARVVGRLFKTNEKNYLKDPEKKREVEVTIPADLQPVTPASGNEGIRLYSTGFTEGIKVTTPPNYILRFAGVVDGELPEDGKPLPPGFKPTYKGNFGVKIWVPAIKNFAKDDIQIPIDASVKGNVKYKAEGGKQESTAYDTGYELLEIKRVTVQKPKIIKVAKKDAEGNLLKDNAGKLVYEEKESPGIPIQTEAAVVRDTFNDNKIEEIVKSGDFERQKESSAWLEKLGKDQEEERKKKDAELKALKDKLKNKKPEPKKTTK